MTKVFIDVRPFGQEWRFECPLSGQLQSFATGGRAEASARSVAQRWARAGLSVELILRDRRDVVVGAICFDPRLCAECPPLPDPASQSRAKRP